VWSKLTPNSSPKVTQMSCCDSKVPALAISKPPKKLQITNLALSHLINVPLEGLNSKSILNPIEASKKNGNGRIEDLEETAKASSKEPARSIF